MRYALLIVDRESARPSPEPTSPEEQVKVTLLINIINGWNRIAVGFGGFVDPQVIKAKMAAA